MLSTLLDPIIMGVLALGLIAVISIAVLRWKLTLRQWLAAGLSALAWGSGWFLGYSPVSEKWNEINDYMKDGNLTADLIGSTTRSGYYGLALGGIIAALLGVAVLYLLMRNMPAE